MSFFLPSSASTSASTSINSSPNPETGLTTLEDVPINDLAKSPPAGDHQTEASALSTPLNPEEEPEGSSPYTPLSRTQSDVYTTTAYTGLDLFAHSEPDVGLHMESESSESSESSSGQASPSGSSSSSGSGSGRDDSASTVRTRATAGGAQTTVDSANASTAVSPSIASTLPRIHLPEEETLRALLFESPLASTRKERTHHRRRSSGSASRSRGVYKYHEDGISRDFLLIVALCTGFACTVIVLGRPAMMSLLGHGGFDME